MCKDKKDKVLDFGQAERNARQRDFDIEKKKFKKDHRGIEKEDFEEAMETLSKATGKDIFIGTKRSVKSKIKFAQTLQENFNFLHKNKYLTNKEKVFLIDIIPFVAFSSNCVVHNIRDISPTPANITEIAELISSDRSNTSKTINSLKKKGIIAKSESGIEGNNTKSYAIFLNPHILYAGDKDNVNDTLKVMFNKSMKMPILKDLPDKLF